MSEREAIWFAHQRRRWMRPDADRFVRPDAHRVMPPGTPRWTGKDAVRSSWSERKHDELANADHSRADAIDEAEALALRGQLRRLHLKLAEIRFDLKFRRFLLSLKYGYNPDQPRVPAGNPDGRQWTDGGGSTGQHRIRLAGEIPTNDPPEIPKKRPSAATERARILREAGKWLAKIAKVGGRIDTAITILEGISWIRDQIPNIQAFRDPPKSLEELQEAVSETSTPGYQDHHIVEQTPGRRDGFPDSMIESHDNIVRIPTLKHRQINGWYQGKNDEYEGLSPREWLRGKPWDTRRSVGLRALIQFEVLKP